MEVNLNWAEIVIALLAMTSFGTRFIAWVRDDAARRRFCLIAAEALERLAGVDSSAADAKWSIGETTKQEGGRVRKIADAVSVLAEKQRDKVGSATKREPSKGRKILDGVMKWAPIIGAFL